MEEESGGPKLDLKKVPTWAWVLGAAVVGVGVWYLFTHARAAATSGTAASSTATGTANTDQATAQSLDSLSTGLQAQQQTYAQQIMSGQANLGAGQQALAGGIGDLASGQSGLAAGQQQLLAGQSGLGTALGSDTTAILGQVGQVQGLQQQTLSGVGNLNSGIQSQQNLLAQMQADFANFHLPTPVAPAPSGYTGAPGEQNNTVPAGAPPTFSNQTTQIQQNFLAAAGGNAAQAQQMWQTEHNAQVAKYGS